MQKYILSVFCCVMLFTAGVLSGLYLAGKKKPVTIVKEQVKYITIDREYNEMRLPDLQSALRCYDKGVPVLDITPLDTNDRYQLIGGLCERRWTRDITIEAGSSENWKFYVGLSIGAVVVAGGTYGIYLLVQRLK